MDITLQLPDDIVRWLGGEAGVLRSVLELVAVHGYRQRKLSRAQVARFVSLDYWQTEEVLTCLDAKRPYTLADLEVDRRTLGVAEAEE